MSPPYSSTRDGSIFRIASRMPSSQTASAPASPLHAHGGGRHGRVARHALEAERVALRLRPAERGHDGQPLALPVAPERLRPVAVPRLHRRGHVHVQAEIGREHAPERPQRVKVPRGVRPHALELVVDYEEVAPAAALGRRVGALGVVESDEIARGGVWPHAMAHARIEISVALCTSLPYNSKTLICRVNAQPLNIFGTWRSLVARLLWEQDVAGSNPVVPTICLATPVLTGVFHINRFLHVDAMPCPEREPGKAVDGPG